MLPSLSRFDLGIVARTCFRSRQRLQRLPRLKKKMKRLECGSTKLHRRARIRRLELNQFGARERRIYLFLPDHISPFILSATSNHSYLRKLVIKVRASLYSLGFGRVRTPTRQINYESNINLKKGINKSANLSDSSRSTRTACISKGAFRKGALLEHSTFRPVIYNSIANPFREVEARRNFFCEQFINRIESKSPISISHP